MRFHKQGYPRYLALLGWITTWIFCPLTMVIGQQPNDRTVMENIVGDDHSFFVKVNESVFLQITGAGAICPNSTMEKRDLIVARGTRFELSDCSLNELTSPNPKVPGRLQTVYDRKLVSSYTVRYENTTSPIEVVAPVQPSAFKKAEGFNNYFVRFLMGKLLGGDLPRETTLMTAEQIIFLPREYHDEFGDWLLTTQSGKDQTNSVTVTLMKHGGMNPNLRISNDDSTLTMRNPGSSWSGNFGGAISLVTWHETLQITVEKESKRPKQITHNLEVHASNAKICKEVVTYDVKTCLTKPSEVDDEVAKLVVSIPNGFVCHVMNSFIDKVWVDGKVVDRIDRKALHDRKFVFSHSSRIARIVLVFSVPILGGIFLLYIRLRRRNSASEK
jgi:hypothetical protein